MSLQFSARWRLHRRAPSESASMADHPVRPRLYHCEKTYDSSLSGSKRRAPSTWENASPGVIIMLSPDALAYAGRVSTLLRDQLHTRRPFIASASLAKFGTAVARFIKSVRAPESSLSCSVE